MKYVIQLFSLLCFSLLTTLTMAQNDMESQFNDLFDQMGANTERATGGSGGSTLSGGDRGGAGGGGDEVLIGIEWAKETSVIADDYRLSWEALDSVDSYIVQIGENKRGSDLNLVYVAHVNSTSTNLPFGNLSLDKDKSYYVKVLSSDGKIKCKNTIVKLVDYSVYEDAIKKVKTDVRYKDASKLEKIMMKAWALEKAGLVMNAYKYYSKYMVDEKEDTVLRNMRQIFVETHQ